MQLKHSSERKIPKGRTSIPILFSLPIPLVDQMDQYAGANSYTRSALLREMIRFWLEEKNKPRYSVQEVENE